MHADNHIIGKIVDALLANGWDLTVDDSTFRPGSKVPTRDRAVVLADLRNRYTFINASRPGVDQWVQVIPAYSGSYADAVADYSVGLEYLIGPILDAA